MALRLTLAALVVCAAMVSGEEGTAALVLQVSPANAKITIDDGPVQVAEEGAAALARVTPGKHVLVATKAGYVTLRKIIDVPADGLEGKVHLAPMLKRVAIRMKSGRTIEGGLVSQKGDRITITRGRGKLSLRKGQYQDLKITGEAPAGKSTFVPERSGPSTRAADEVQDAVPPLPEGTLAQQVDALRERFDTTGRSFADALRTHGKRSRVTRRLRARLAALAKQAEGLVPRIETEIQRSRGVRKSLIDQGRREDSLLVKAADAELNSFEALLKTVSDLSAATDRKTAKTLPEGFEKAFMLPDSGKDQYGKPVTIRNGRDHDPKTGWPFEIWLKDPRMEFVLIPPGEFMMGSSMSPEEVVAKYGGTKEEFKREHPQHKVRITRPFYLGKYEVTVGQYRVHNPKYTPEKREDLPPEVSKMAVHKLMWSRTAHFCDWVAQLTGVTVRLPTEAEWEYACRADTSAPYPWGTDKPATRPYANTRGGGDGSGFITLVGRYPPNAWGLYDTIGNAAEACIGMYDEAYYRKSPETDPLGPAGGTLFIYRGGSWYSQPHHARTAYRFPVDYRGWISNGLRCLTETPYVELAGSGSENALQRGELPEHLRDAFEAPRKRKDQYGNPVVRRNGDKRDRETGLPYEIWLKDPQIEFVLVSAGEFVMGADEDAWQAAPAHQVRITRPYYLGKYELTQAQWQEIAGTQPWADDKEVVSKGRHAAEYLSWNDCHMLAAKLNERAEVKCFRLPTAAEWEYACRAGSAGAYCFGDDAGQLERYAWFGQGPKAERRVRAIGLKLPNAWGFHDMHGNVVEWCRDYFYKYRNIPTVDPCGWIPSRYRVSKGGSVSHHPTYCKSATHNASKPTVREPRRGVRLYVSCVP